MDELKVEMERIYQIIGQLYLELDVIKGMNKRLLGELQAEKAKVNNLSAPQNPDQPQ